MGAGADAPGRAAVTVRLELPFPPASLSPNARVHWRKKAAIVADYREEVAWTGWAARERSTPSGYKGATITFSPTLEPPVRAAVTFVVPDHKRRDEQNFLEMLKPAFDGLVDAGILVDDNAKVFSVESTEIRVEKGKSYVVVELRGGEQRADP